jgi:polar amino acid transport system substrate-binding protein
MRPQVPSKTGYWLLLHPLGVMKKILLTLYLVGQASLALAGNAPQCPKAISFALYENGYIYDSASDSGIDKDVAEELARRSGCRFEFSVRPRARIWAELESGFLMMTGSGIQTAKRDEFSWAVRYMAQKNYVLVKKTVSSQSPAQFNADPKLLWGAVRSYKHGSKVDEFLDSLRQQNRVVEEPDLGSVFRIFSKEGRTSAVLAPPPAYAKYLKEWGLTDRVRIEDWFPEELSIPHSLIFSKKAFSEEEIKKWRRIVGQMRADGTLHSIYTKYLGATDAGRMMMYKED